MFPGPQQVKAPEGQKPCRARIPDLGRGARLKAKGERGSILGFGRDAGLAYTCPYPLYGPASFPDLPEERNVKVYSGANIRNVAMVGHGHAGKTTLVSAMLYTAGATQRLGRVDDGTATTDYDDEEVSRKMSISASLAYAEWGNTKINFLDTPGFNTFIHEAQMVLPVVESAL